MVLRNNRGGKSFLRNLIEYRVTIRDISELVTGIGMPISYHKRLKMTSGENWNTIRITIKNLGSLGTGPRTKDQSSWNNH